MPLTGVMTVFFGYIFSIVFFAASYPSAPSRLSVTNLRVFVGPPDGPQVHVFRYVGVVCDPAPI